MKHYLLLLFCCCLFFLPATLLAQQATFSEVVYLNDTIPNDVSGITGYALATTADNGYMLAGGAYNNAVCLPNLIRQAMCFGPKALEIHSRLRP